MTTRTKEEVMVELEEKFAELDKEIAELSETPGTSLLVSVFNKISAFLKKVSPKE